MLKELKFTVDSALLRELGEKLVETVHLAISELVKNAYDADATKVEILFEINEQGRTRIKIIDNGTGMNFEAVQNYWMRIATTNKTIKNVSSVYGRPLTGAKGIGRFSCRRLGSKLILITKGTEQQNLTGKQRDIQQTTVMFPWNDFEAGTEVTTIKCPGSQEVIPEESTGTDLIIEDISEEWTTRGINWLKRQLAVLSANRGTKRPGYNEDPGFEVLLSVPDFEGGIRDIRDDLINAGWGTLSAYINAKHQAVCELNALGIGRRTITSSDTFPLLTDTSLRVGIMVDNREQMRDVSVLSKGTLANILPDWGGVQVRNRGFRVYPYGDDDWLGIDYDRGLRRSSPKRDLLVFAESLRGVDASRSLLNMLSMRSYIGNVEIGSDSKNFEMKASREGFLESPAVFKLRDFVRFAIDWSTILRDYYLRLESQKVAVIAKEELENMLGHEIEKNAVVDSALNYIDDQIKTVTHSLPPNQKIHIEQSLGKATEAIKKFNDSSRIELAHLRLIASTSTLLLIFSHEVKSLLGLLEQSKNSLHRISKGLAGENKILITGIGDSFTDLTRRLEELLQLTSLMSSDKSSVKPGRVALKSRILKVEKVFELITNKYEIEIDHEEVPNNIVFRKILEAELYAILLNLLSNSIKAVIAKGKEKSIKISAKSSNNEIIITIKDTGVGLKQERFKEVFIPFVADPDGQLYHDLEKRINPEDSMIVGIGSGLGLGIVKEIVSAHGGTISFTEPQGKWSTELKLTLG